MLRVMEVLSSHSNDGIGIEKFFQGKVIFITGATGFIGKVLVEKILRTMPDVSKIYLMIRAKDKEGAMQRLKTEILEAELFKCVKQQHGNCYEAFMMSKVVPVVGNIGRPDLGLEEEFANEIKNNVQIIVNSAAHTSFYPRYDSTLDINAMGPSHMMGFAKRCFKLELFLLISTVYVNVPGTRRSMEEKLSLETNSMVREIPIPKSTGRSLPALILENERKLIEDCKKTYAHNTILANKLKELGSQRAKGFGRPNAYMFAKAIGEMLMIDTIRKDIPVVILRPSGTVSSYNEPFPGWLDGYKSIDPIIWEYGKGKLTGFPGKVDNVTDIVPVDMVVNATLAAMAMHGRTKQAGINFYHVSTSSTSNPLILKNIFDLLFEHFKSWPCMDQNGNPIRVQEMKIFSSMEGFNAHLLREDALNYSNPTLSEKIERRKNMEVAKYLAKVYEPIVCYTYRFSTSNTDRLLESMSEEEEKKFGFDVRSIDWKHYIVNVHVPGLRRHVVKENNSTSKL